MSRNCGNPLLRDWVKEWMEQAQAIQSKAYYTYKKAYESLDKCTEEFDHPSQTITLAGIGPGLAAKLEERMTRYCKDNGLPLPQRPPKGRRKKGNQNTDDEDDTTRPVRKARAYVPQYRTGGYGILLCLLEFYVMGRENISKEQICRVAQDFCNASYTLADPGKSYTAWSSMKTLLEKGYVYKNGSPAKFSLTDTGVDIAKRLKASGAPATDSNNQAGPSTSTTTMNDEVIETFHRNPSTARSSSQRRDARGSSTNDILDSTLDSYDTTSNEVDMSLYVLNPSQHQSISINGRKSNTNSYNDESSSSSRMHEDPDILHALAESSRPKKKQRSNRGNGRSRGGKRKSTSATAALLDDLLDEFGEQSSGPDMSQYVLNPSEHQSITVGGRTVHNNSTTTSSSNNSSSINNIRRSSFARDFMSTSEIDGFNSINEVLSSPPSLSNYSSTSRANNSGRYRTPASSSILQKYSNSNKTNKSSYDIDDDDDIDLTPSTLPTLQSSQVEMQSDDIVDLLSSPEPSPIIRPTTNTDETSFHADFDLETDYFPVSQALTEQITDETFHYTYLNSKNEDVRTVAKADISVDEEHECLAYRIRFYTSQRYHPKCKKLIQVSKDDTHIDCSIGYISELDTDSICPGLPARPVLPLHCEEPDDFWPAEPSGAGVCRYTMNESSQRSMNSHISSQSSIVSQPILSQTSFSQQSSQQQSQTQTQQTQQDIIDYNQLVESVHLECMLPNEYEIMLILDNREIQMKTSRDYFQRKLTEKGIKCITRALDLGDVIWVARKKNTTNEDEELFLDYIVERKRLDDLISSIKDGRYVEQKKRLRISGAEKVIYVVEEYNRDDAVNFGLQAIQTAISSLQIIEGFYLRRTDNIDETIDFLVSATKLMNHIYKDTTLYSIPGEIITRQNYLDLKKAFRAKSSRNNTTEKSAYLIKYPLYAELNTKNGATTVGEVYLRMLMTIRGVNAERAMSLTKIYPTPHALLKAFQGKTAEEGKKLAKDATKHHINRRRWGANVSEQLYNIWGADTYPLSVEEDFDD